MNFLFINNNLKQKYKFRIGNIISFNILMYYQNLGTLLSDSAALSACSGFHCFQTDSF